MVFGLLKLKVTTHGIKALVEEKKEIKLKKREELFNKVEKVSLSAEKGKAKKTRSEEFNKDFDKELGNLSPLVDEVVEPSRKKRKITMKKEVLRE